MERKERRTARMFKWIGIAVGAMVVVLYVFLPVGIGVVSVWPARGDVGDAPEGFADVAVGTRDGETLAAWYRPAMAETAVLVTHGAGGSRDSVREYVEFLAEAGYGVLAVDLRGHGESTGKTNRLGWNGTADVRAAVDVLKAQGAERIVGLGLSMGGEVLLGAASQVPELEAIVADGATRRSTSELLALPSERPLWRSFTARLMFATSGLLSGDPEPLPLLESMAASRARFLLIAGGDAETEVALNERFAETLGDRAMLWVAPGAGHTQAHAVYPDEYEARVLAFFFVAP